MKVIAHKDSGRVIAYGATVTQKPNGLLCGGVIYPDDGYEILDFEGEVVPFKHRIKNGVVSISPEFEAQEDEIKRKAKEELALDIVNDGVELKKAVDTLFTEGKVAAAKVEALTAKMKLTIAEKDEIVKK
jgi:hypothetical protein